jgi:6-phosphofructokinase 1
VIGVPKTIDNDLSATELTFGFMTAIDIATEALDRLHTTAASHDRVMILEVMGRNTGWIALHAGLAGSADVILIPEIPFSFESVLAKIRQREKSGSRFTNVVVAEGALEVGHQPLYLDKEALRLGGVGSHLRRRIEAETGKESRCVVLGHLQRGGSPNAFDRMLGTNFGACAVRALLNGQTGKMVALQAGTVTTVPLADAIANIKKVSVDGQLVRTARDIGISFAAPNESKL